MINTNHPQSVLQLTVSYIRVSIRARFRQFDTYQYECNGDLDQVYCTVIWFRARLGAGIAQ